MLESVRTPRSEPPELSSQLLREARPVCSTSQLRHESRQLFNRPDLFPGREPGMESHVLGGDPGPGPREPEAPLQLPAASFPEAGRERRLERLSALTRQARGPAQLAARAH